MLAWMKPGKHRFALWAVFLMVFCLAACDQQSAPTPPPVEPAPVEPATEPAPAPTPKPQPAPAPESVEQPANSQTATSNSTTSQPQPQKPIEQAGKAVSNVTESAKKNVVKPIGDGVGKLTNLFGAGKTSSGKSASKTTTTASQSKPKPTPKPQPAPEPKLDYKVVLAVDEALSMPGPAGEMIVWIGGEDVTPDLPQRMVQDEKPLHRSGDSAKVEPSAPDFKVTPATSDCVLLDPTGSELRFWLEPIRTGEFFVSANVFLYDSPDCSGPPVPKTPKSLQVVVAVNKSGMLTEGLWELGTIFWSKLVEFWGALVVLFFGLLLFLIRGKLKKWFGFEG